MKKRLNNQGFSLVEILLAISIFALLATAFAGAIIYGEQSAVIAGQRGRATFLAQEGVEALKSIRNANYSNLNDGSFGLAVQGGAWALSGSPDKVDIFTRQIQISSISTSTKDVVVIVSWQQNLQRVGSVSLESRLSNFMGN